MSRTPTPADDRITSPRSARLRAAAKLTHRSWRTKEGRFLAEGPQAVREAVAAAGHRGAPVPVQVAEVFVTEEAAARHSDIFGAAAAARIPVRTIADGLIGEISDTVASQGIVAVCASLDVPLTAVLTERARLVVVLSQVRDPGNAGTVLRVADAAGADAVVVTSASVDIYNPKTVRSTAGSLFHVPVVTGVGLPEVAELARARGLQVLAADAHPPAHDLHQPWETGLDLARPTLWVFGNEAWGLPEKDRAECDGAVAIPIYGRAESLNLGTAAAICIYESARAAQA